MMAASPGAGAEAGIVPPDRASLGQAVAALYTSTDPAVRLQADEWLQSFLRSDHAWPLSIQLLSNASDLTSLEALFCARALHVLLRKSVVKPVATQASHAVLDQNDWVQMRDALLQLAWNFSVKVVGAGFGGGNNTTMEAPPRAVLTQVSLAISVLACKMTTWDAETIVVDLVTHFLGTRNGSGEKTSAPPSAKEIVTRLVDNRPELLSTRPGSDQTAFIEQCLTTAGEQCLVSILTVLPEEVHSKGLSIHPARRAAVAEGMKKVATSVVFPTLDALATKAFDGTPTGDNANSHYARASSLNACASWSLFDENQDGCCPSASLSFAVFTLSSDELKFMNQHSIVVDAAVSLATTSLVGAVHRAKRRQALAEELGVLRQRCRGSTVGAHHAQNTNTQNMNFVLSELRSRCAQVLASVACRAADPPPLVETPVDPFGVGKDASRDRTYVPYKNFAKMRKAKKRSDKRDDHAAAAAGTKPAPLVGCDLEVLCFCLDALADGMCVVCDSGTGFPSPASALEPWASVATAIESYRACGGVLPQIQPELVNSAARVAGVASSVVPKWFPPDGESAANDGGHFGEQRVGFGGDAFGEESSENDANREDLAEGLRDVANVVGPDVFLQIAGKEFELALHSNDTKKVEGWTFVLFACARLVTKSHSESSSDTQHSVTQVVQCANAVIRNMGKISPRAVELSTWILGGLSKAISGSDGSDSEHGVLLQALQSILFAMAQPSPSIARGACVASMRVVETNCAAVAGTDFHETRNKLLEAYRVGVASPPLEKLRRGQEPVSTILARGISAVASAMEPAHDAETAAATLAAPAAASATAAATAVTQACSIASVANNASSLDAAVSSALNASLSLYVALVETKVVAEALLVASRRAKQVSNNSKAPCDEVLRLSVFPAAVAAVEAARQARPLFAHVGFGCDAEEGSGAGGAVSSSRVRRKTFGSLRGTQDIISAAADLVRSVVKASVDCDDFSSDVNFKSAIHLATEAYRADPMYNHPVLSALVDGCHAKSGSEKFLVLSNAAGVVLTAALNDEASLVGEKNRAAVFALAQAAIRAGFPSLSTPSSQTHTLFTLIAQVAVRSLLEPTSGEAALVTLQFAGDVACSASMLCPEQFAPGRTYEQAVSATAVHPGMGRLASAMSGSSQKGGYLPKWAVGGSSLAVATTAAQALTVASGDECGIGIGPSIVRGMLQCACGVMPPGLVTDISAALFLIWSACGDAVFGSWLVEALGPDRNGFPRKTTTIEQKTFFVNELLGLPDEAVPVGEREAIVKMDLRRFKRVVKAFCGGKKVGK